MSGQEHQQDAAAEEEQQEKPFDDLEPSEADAESLRGGVLPPDEKK